MGVGPLLWFTERTSSWFRVDYKVTASLSPSTNENQDLCHPPRNTPYFRQSRAEIALTPVKDKFSARPFPFVTESSMDIE
ncbi:hypothetical protein [Desulfatitalea alkaliphila]|uniref:Uncharacterized protein n=1 Tax=Desulfatitalea alkaliphila TaxID=2929485 RepID=A0AA41UIC2_9BACT|nr:hypothetical protein [Desulfatitalea alkaliphila]MCJ8499452.1 hypothetical protein [Desulfatitalea alkaliphila]